MIAAFNADKPYDRFILEQIAGDTFGVDEATGLLIGICFFTGGPDGSGPRGLPQEKGSSHARTGCNAGPSWNTWELERAPAKRLNRQYVEEAIREGLVESPWDALVE